MNRLIRLLIAASLLCAANAAWAPAQEQDKPADNTRINKRDRSKDQPTADQQKENPNDREITRKIRRAIVEDKSLSTYGHNVKIITQNGRVTLKGPVRSQEEKDTIAAKAAAIAGEDRVDNQLEVKPKND
jgi:osmotically-inducible protein OsmY